MRERVWENTKSHGEEEGWTRVRRGYRRVLPASRFPVQKNDVKDEGARKRTSGFSIFVDNLPKFYDSHLLKKLFHRNGRITNSYVAWKRRIINNTRYGFVCFSNEEEALKAIKNLDGVVIFGFKLMVKLSFNARKKVEERRKPAEKGEAGKIDGRSYVEVAAGKKDIGKEKSTSTFMEGGESSAQGLEGLGIPILRDTVARWKELEESNGELRKRIEELEIIISLLQADFEKWKDRGPCLNNSSHNNNEERESFEKKTVEKDEECREGM